MLSKRAQYLAGFSHCTAMAQAAPSDDHRQSWSLLADSYLTLLKFEDRHPTEVDDGHNSLAKPLVPFESTARSA